MSVAERAIGEQGIGERVISERENLGESDREEIVKTTSVMFGVYIPGIKIDYELLVSKSS